MGKCFRLIFVICSFIVVSACGKIYDLDIDTVKKEAINSIYNKDLKNINFGNYSKDDVVLNKICKASKSGSNFAGEYLIFWESSNGEESDKVVWTNEGEIFNKSNLGLIYEIYNDDCEDL